MDTDEYEATTVACSECEAPIDTESDPVYYTEGEEDYQCAGCWDSAIQYGSRAYQAGPGFEVDPETGTVPLVIVTEYGVLDGAYYERVKSPLARSYHSSDGWGGCYVTRVTEEGWAEVSSGWTTGNWGDAIADSKQDFNSWAESIISGKVVPPFPVWIIFDPTSNVFSTAVGVWVPDQHAHAATIPGGL